VPGHKKGNKTDRNNYRGISLLSTSYNILSNILLSSLSPHIDKIIGDNQCVFQRNIKMYDLDYFSFHFIFILILFFSICLHILWYLLIFQLKFCVYFSSILFCIPYPSHSSRLYQRNHILWMVQIRKLFILQFTPSSCYFLSYRS
jgi:hypothetical protein